MPDEGVIMPVCTSAVQEAHVTVIVTDERVSDHCLPEPCSCAAVQEAHVTVTVTDEHA